MKDIKENAHISLISKQCEGNKKDEMNFDTRGGFYVRDGKYFITYSEHRDMGMGDSRIVLKIEPDMITMRRMGDFQTVMVYKKNELTEFIYRVPFGELNLKIKTRSIKNDLNETGGTVNFCYDLFAGEGVTYNDITITVDTGKV